MRGEVAAQNAAGREGEGHQVLIRPAPAVHPRSFSDRCGGIRAVLGELCCCGERVATSGCRLARGDYHDQQWQDQEPTTHVQEQAHHRCIGSRCCRCAASGMEVLDRASGGR